MKKIARRALKCIVGVLYFCTVAFFPTALIWLAVTGITYMFWEANPLAATWEWLNER